MKKIVEKMWEYKVVINAIMVIPVIHVYFTTDRIQEPRFVFQLKV